MFIHFLTLFYKGKKMVFIKNSFLYIIIKYYQKIFLCLFLFFINISVFSNINNPYSSIALKNQFTTYFDNLPSSDTHIINSETNHEDDEFTQMLVDNNPDKIGQLNTDSGKSSSDNVIYSVETLSLTHSEANHNDIPNLIWILPFVILLLCIAILPLINKTKHWWEHNKNKLIISIVLSIITCTYYFLRSQGFHHAETGFPTVLSVLHHAIISDYIPFIILLFSLYTISGNINLSGDIPAHPLTNTIFIGIGGILASFIGTTGASMLLIRPLLQINSERKNVKHTVIFFIFVVSNCGGLLLPIGDPPLFLGYLRGVPFLWTLSLFPEWLTAMIYLLVFYFIWDSILYNKEPKEFLILDETKIQPLVLSGRRNFILLFGVVLSVGLLVPGQKLIGTDWILPNIYLREIIMLILAGIAYIWTSKEVRIKNDFNFIAIIEVAFLFIGIFITMQVPLEILQLEGSNIGLSKPWQFFWATGALSSFLDNAPTYIVYFATAGSIKTSALPVIQNVFTATNQIAVPLLKAISIGAVFMGANTYIGNGPNFMVKSIAEQNGVKMPSFFGYIIYSVCILFPLYFIIQFIFLR